MALSLLLTLCAIVGLVSSASLRISVPASNLLQNPNTLPASTHAVLTSGSGPSVTAVLKKGNYIDIPDIQTTGSHLLEIYTRDFIFAPYRIDILATSISSTVITGAWETYRGTRWEDRGVALVATPTGHLDMHAKVLSKKNFYQEREGFNVLSLLKNPMVLLGGGALLFTTLMPKLMENMDPEMKEEYEKMQKQSSLGGLTSALQGGGGGGPASNAANFDLAGYLAGSGKSSSSGRDAGADGVRERKR